MPEVILKPLAELCRAQVLQLLNREGLIDDSLIQMIMNWPHTSGFRVHHKVCIEPIEEKGLEHLLLYIGHDSFALSKMGDIMSAGALFCQARKSHRSNQCLFKRFMGQPLSLS